MKLARRTPIMPIVEPVVPTLRSAPFNHPGWLFEPKYDGFRGMLYLSRRDCVQQSPEKAAVDLIRSANFLQVAAQLIRVFDAIQRQA
jgi:hypothetical protein